VLVGIAAGMTLTAWTGLFVLGIDSPAVPTLSFFIFGSLAGTTMTSFAIAAPLILLVLGALWWLGPGIDLLSLGEQQSIHLGFDARRRVPAAVAAIGIAIGASVALGGVIGFVGLIVPLALRAIVGPSQRVLIPASAMGGAIMVLVFDVAARTLAAPVEIPIGLLTAAVGGPVLVWLVRRDVAQ
jgi:iron complex transport system permease protein